jgi:uncharacterized DUF497 family protein
MRITRVYFASEDVEDKVKRRGIDLIDLCEVFRRRPVIHVDGRDRFGNKKYFAWGQTQAGRFLFIVFVPERPTDGRIISARDMSPKEKKRHIRS